MEVLQPIQTIGTDTGKILYYHGKMITKGYLQGQSRAEFGEILRKRNPQTLSLYNRVVSEIGCGGRGSFCVVKAVLTAKAKKHIIMWNIRNLSNDWKTGDIIAGNSNVLGIDFVGFGECKSGFLAGVNSWRQWLDWTLLSNSQID